MTVLADGLAVRVRLRPRGLECQALLFRLVQLLVHVLHSYSSFGTIQSLSISYPNKYIICFELTLHSIRSDATRFPLPNE